jgi:DNA polymerase I-like protein with 3'-5' exonuclease and polymerase domains
MWQPPANLPDLRRAGVIALDTETRDDGLRNNLGSAWPWGDGYVCGVSVAWRAEGDIRAHYIPLRHPDSPNFDREQVFTWLQDLVASDVRFITHNGLYDWGWLSTGGVAMPPSDRLEEIIAQATLVDENRFTYGLDTLCAWRGLPGKDETLLEQAVRAAGFAKRKKKINAREHIWQLPAHAVGTYAETDAASTFALWENLNPILDREGTRRAYRLEIDLLPMVLEMRRRGIRIDQTAAESARDLCLRKRDATLAEISEKLGTPISMVEINGKKWKAQTFDTHSISYPRTPKGNPSFRAGKTGWMLTHPHWLPPLIAQATKYDTAAGKFFESHILNHIVNGRVYSEIHPHRADDGGGAKSLRFSYSDPPLQQMPSRDKELAPLVRGVFLPDEGEIWAKSDISQQEFRFIVHHAASRNLPQAMAAAEIYCSNANADFHATVADMTGLARGDAKAVNFAKVFGAGPAKFAEMIGRPLHEAKDIITQYDGKLPFVQRLAKICEREAKRLGYTELYDGARRHWDYWEAAGVFAKGAGPCSLEEAQRRRADPEHAWHGRYLRRYKVHTALNALIQGSAARHTKLWMRAVWREGVVPLLQMHDALDCSVTSREQGELVARLGYEAVALKVPIVVDLKFGRTWGDATHTWAELGSAQESPGTKINGTQLPIQTAIKLPPLVEEDFAEDQVPLPALIGEPVMDGKILCPFHDEQTPSCHIYPDHYHCFGCGAHGDHIDWLMLVDGLSRKEARQRLENWDGPLVRPIRDCNSEKAKLARALRIWDRAKPIAGTLATQYLANYRKIDVAALPDTINDVLRFHPNCPFGPDTRHSCLIALLRDATTDAPTGIHRIALAPDGSKIERRMLGHAGIAKLWPAGGTLIVGEGIETVLAAATRITHRGTALQPAWSAISSGGLGKLPVISGVEQLILLVDNDSNGTGQAAAEECAEHWREQGRDVEQLMPAKPGTDFNDMVLA